MGTGTAAWCSPLSALLHCTPLVPAQRYGCVACGICDAAGGSPGSPALQAESQDTLRLPQRSRTCGCAPCARHHQHRAGSGHRLGSPSSAGCEQEAASCLPTSSLSPSQPHCSSPEPPASAEHSAVAGGVFITLAGGSAFCTSALRATAVPPRLRWCKGGCAQGKRGCSLPVAQQSCAGGVSVCWVLGGLAMLTLYGGALQSLFPSGFAEAGSCSLQWHRVRSLGAGGLGPWTPPPAQPAGCPCHRTGQGGCSNPEPLLQS